jgi:hypothetical protein
MCFDDTAKSIRAFPQEGPSRRSGEAGQDSFFSQVVKVDVFKGEGIVVVGDFEDAVHGDLRMLRVEAAARY